MEALNAAITAQGQAVKLLKTNAATPEEVKAGVDKLLNLKKELSVLQADAIAEQKAVAVLREGVEQLAVRKFFYVPSFEIYGGFKGLYDFGPPGCAVKENILTLWRQHFVLTERMLEVACTCVTPAAVLKTSGHVDRFSDFMVTDLVTKRFFRADKLLEEHIEALLDDVANPVSPEKAVELRAIHANADAYTAEELGAKLLELKVKTEDGNDFTAPFPFNLMFKTSIGPSGKSVGFLRPETAQGIFVNFKRLLYYNRDKMPFAAAQVGLAFRNEIKPQAGLLRVREFPMAEIEHFVHPEKKDHPKFKNVEDLKMTLLPGNMQDGVSKPMEISIGSAVEQKIVNNQTLGYFLARTQLFLEKIGIKRDKLRFRQHKEKEMAHYANDCWDAEIHTTYGWIECVGHADRGAFDLTMHSDVTGKDLLAREEFKEPKIVKLPNFKLDNRVLGKTFGKKQKPVKAWLTTSITVEEGQALQAALEGKADGKYTKVIGEETYELTSPMIKEFGFKDKKIFGQNYLPNVVEPSFGIGRILYAVIEHAYTTRVKDGETESYLAFKPIVAPFKVVIATISAKDNLLPYVDQISEGCIHHNLAYDVDHTSGALGRKYARADEVGVPFSMAIDFDTLTDNQVTIRERDSTKQVRLPIAIAALTVSDLITGRLTWPAVVAKYGEFGNR